MTSRTDAFKVELSEQIAALRRYAFVLAGNRADAEDLVQECLTRAIAAAASWPGGPNLRRWLFRIMHNAHVSDLRRRRVRADYDADLAADPVQPPNQPLEMEAKAVLAALSQLPEPQREAVALVAIEGMRYAEAAAILGVPLGTLMSRLARGREALRRILEVGEAPALRVVRSRP